MRNLLLSCATLLLSTSSLHAEEGWTPLFNGKNLDGWTVKIQGQKAGVNWRDTFVVEEGAIKVNYAQYKEPWNKTFGHLFYNAPFSHYKLRVEYRFTGDQVDGGPAWAHRNSGIMIHGEKPEEMEMTQPFPKSIEVQLLGGLGEEERSTANLCTPGTHVVYEGKLHKAHCTTSRSKTFHGDQWVTVELEVNGHGTIRHFVNGEFVMEYEQAQRNDGTPLEGGTISLQSESHPVEFRKVEILKLAE